MNDETDLERWKRSHRAVAAPPHFADRVMERVLAEGRRLRSPEDGPRALPSWARSPLASAAALVVAALLFVGRLLGLFLVFAAR